MTRWTPRRRQRNNTRRGRKLLRTPLTPTQAWLRAGVTTTILFQVIYMAWLVLRPGSAHVVQLGDDILETSGGILATLLCFAGPRRGLKTPGWRVPLFCGLGLLCYTLTQFYIISPDFMGHPSAIPRLADDLLALAADPLLLLGIWCLPRRSLTLAAHLRVSLDGLMVITAALTFSWFFVVGPIFLGAHHALEARIVSVCYPLMDVLLVACLFLLGGRTPGMGTIRALLAGGLLVVVASDTVWSYLTLHSAFPAASLLDTGWSLGFMPVGVAAAAARYVPTAPPVEAETASPLWKSLLPYALLPFVAALVIYTEQAPGSAPLRHGAFWGALALVGLILVRQVLAILENRALNQRLESLATTDPLTGLPNHRAFHKRLGLEAERAGREGKALAVAVLDLDNFKFFNDAYGHLVGDEVLREVARALSAQTETGDTCARFGGDEFALLMPHIEDRTAPPGYAGETVLRLTQALAARLSALAYCPPGGETAIPLTVSIGVALFPGDAETRLEALEIAHMRLSQSGDTDHPAERACRELSRSVSGFSMLDALVTAVDNKDRYTRRHSEDVLTYGLQIAERLGLDAETRRTVQIAALLHDVGKIGVPDRILRKPGKLTDEEFQAIQQHPMMGAVIVGAVPGFEDTLDVVRHHHERWDGGGYPFGLQGEETPLLARLMAVADALSAMTTDRPYRKGMGRARALAILEDGAGTQWDPECVEALLDAYRPCRELARAA